MFEGMPRSRTRLMFAAATILAVAPSLVLAQTSEDRIRASEQALRDQQVQQQLNTLEQRQTNLDIELRSQQNLRQMQEQSARAAQPLVLPSYSSTASGVTVVTAPPSIAPTEEEKTAAEKAAKTKKLKPK